MLYINLFRYATIRKSYTLPHNMAGAAGGTEGRIYDNPNTMKQRPEAQPIYAATQGHQGSLPKKVFITNIHVTL